MSYGIGIVILKEDLQKPQIRFDFCDWTISVAVAIHPEECKRNFKDRWYPSFNNESKLTTLEKLITAPCDIVAIIDEEGNFDYLKDHKPLDCSKGSGNEYWYLNIKEYLTGIKYEQTKKAKEVAST